ncbi:MAG TPA: hypothetical protein VG273_20000 [Bryobacteraceae bacterium]|jgi:hypothetical protein|nr:hypothetical protein [Bryobacteraceae bacterium]
MSDRLTTELLDLGKPLALLCYAAFGLFLVHASTGRRLPHVSVPRWLLAALAGIMTALVLFRFSQYGLLFPVAVIAGVAVFATSGNWRSIPGEFAILVAATSLAWWLKGDRQPAWFWRIAGFALTAWFIQAGLSHRAERSARSAVRICTALFGIIGLALIVNVSPYYPGSEPSAQLLHHQGAYVGSALHVLAGLVPFYDVPLQYGLGPTLAIVAGCRISNCWQAVQFLTVATTLLMGLCILRMSLATHRLRGWQWKAAATAVIFCAVFLWPGFPDEGSVRAALPGASGMRFLPVVLISFLLFFERPGWAAGALVPAMVWSPETACMSMAVFGICETARIGLVRAARKTASIAAASILGLFLVHRLWFGVWIQPDVMLEYVLHVPAPLPIHPLTDFIFLVAAFSLTAWIIHKPSSDPLEFRRDLIAASLLFAAANYYMGRSHPNNVCSIMPFIALVGIRALARPAVSRKTIVGLAAATAAISLSFWDYPPFARWSMSHPAFVTPDLELAKIREQISNPLHESIADFGWFRIRNPEETILWTPMDPSSLWGQTIPDERLKLYIKRSAARLKLSGWAIISDDQQYLLNDLRAAYKVTGETRYGQYTVAHFDPIAKQER